MATSRDDGVREIIARMLDGTWAEESPYAALAKEFGVEPASVRHWVFDAARFIRVCRGSEKEIRERVLANIDHAGRLALARKRERRDGTDVDDPDVRSFLGAQELTAKVHRLIGPRSEQVEQDTQTTQADEEAVARALVATGRYTVTRTDGASRAEPDSGLDSEAEATEARKAEDD